MTIQRVLRFHGLATAPTSTEKAPTLRLFFPEARQAVRTAPVHPWSLAEDFRVNDDLLTKKPRT